jgi:hypothetical protein
MDAYQSTVLITTILGGLATPVLLWRAIHNRDTRRLYDIALGVALMGYVCWEAFHPTPLSQMPPPRILLEATLVVLLSDRLFGFSRRLFKRRKAIGTQDHQPPV